MRVGMSCSRTSAALSLAFTVAGPLMTLRQADKMAAQVRFVTGYLASWQGFTAQVRSPVGPLAVQQHHGCDEMQDINLMFSTLLALAHDWAYVLS